MEVETNMIKCDLCGKLYNRGEGCCGNSMRNKPFLSRDDMPNFSR